MESCSFYLVLLVAMVTTALVSTDSMNRTTGCRGWNSSCLQFEQICNRDKGSLVAESCCKLANSSAETGVYFVQGAEGGFAIKKARCDMDSDGGGWTVVQRRVNINNSMPFNKSWTEYKEGFGDLSSEFWYGLKALHVLTSQGEWEMRVELESTKGEFYYKHYSRVEVKGEENGYMLNLSRGSRNKNTTDFMKHFSGKKFSTHDKDNDGDGTIPCAQLFKGGWWYPTTCRADKSLNLNAELLQTQKKWRPSPGKYIRLARTEMKIRPKRCL